MNESTIIGCILGTAVGDALGLPYENMSRRRGLKIFGEPDRYHFFFGRGMVSDDTEHTCMAAQALIEARGDVAKFERSLARRFRYWLLGQPAGIGLATLRAILRLWIGFPPSQSGVNSAGNGPAMRAAIFGAAIDDPQLLREMVTASTRITHRDSKAREGALAVALAAQMASLHERVEASDYMMLLDESEFSAEFMKLMSQVVDSAGAGQGTESFAAALGLSRGVSGYIYHTVPVVIHAWLSHPQDFRAAVQAVIRCGGDTDSTAAIVGGIAGAAVGREGIPTEWLSQLMERPRTVTWMESLGKQLAISLESATPVRVPRLPVLSLVARNLFFLSVVLCHGFRRLMPPY